ncbi:hypothetical protein [uncultured Fluviicola sp.]|uniref:hypothetical protein n=1 Tax=uncultured Fluviicola sp. TaxID=463303 RepID=UPI0025E2B047|nr:hypothetical protein [uncultured Fluviicola sp.]
MYWCKAALNNATFLKYSSLILVFTAGMNILSCTKKKTPVPTIPEPTKWEKIAGHYKVFDTIGVYLYDMDLVHLYNESENQDSIRFQNFDDEFTFSALQVEFSSIPMYVRIGGGDTLYDSNNKRWKVSAGISDYYNNWNNDTIRLRFNKINYYISDVTPYYACDCKQIAVKQY